MGGGVQVRGLGSPEYWQMTLSLWRPSQHTHTHTNTHMYCPLSHRTIFFVMYSDDNHKDKQCLWILISLIFSSCLIFFHWAFKYLLCLVLWCFIKCTLNSFHLSTKATAATCVLVEEGFLHLFTWHHIGICMNSVSRGAYPDEQWSPPLIGKQHCCSYPDFPQEDRARVCPWTVPINPELAVKATTATCVLVEEGLLYLFIWHHIGICMDSVSRGASPDERWSPLLIGKWHCWSHPGFPQEDRARVCPWTVPINPELVPNSSVWTVAPSELSLLLLGIGHLSLLTAAASSCGPLISGGSLQQCWFAENGCAVVLAPMDLSCRTLVDVFTLILSLSATVVLSAGPPVLICCSYSQKCFLQ